MDPDGMAGEGQKALGDVGNTEDEKRSADDGRQGRLNSKAVSQLSHHVQLPRRLIFILPPAPHFLSLVLQHHDPDTMLPIKRVQLIGRRMVSVT